MTKVNTVHFATARAHLELEVAVRGAPPLELKAYGTVVPFVALLEYAWTVERGWFFLSGRVTGRRVLKSGGPSKQVFGYRLVPGQGREMWMDELIARHTPPGRPGWSRA